jgi:hypothetical protein
MIETDICPSRLKAEHSINKVRWRNHHHRIQHLMGKGSEHALLMTMPVVRQAEPKTAQALVRYFLCLSYSPLLE